MKKKAAIPITPWGKRCRIRLMEKEMTMKDLAAQLGNSYTYLSGIINGRVMPAESTIIAINKALDISEEEYSKLNNDYLLEAAK